MQIKNKIVAADNKEPREAQVFRFHSSGFNRSKYLVLLAIDEMERPATFESIYMDTPISYQSLITALPRWLSWHYIHRIWRKGRWIYLVSSKGRRFLWLLADKMPDTTDKWIAEWCEWLRIRPLISPGEARQVLIKVIEPMKYHPARSPRPSLIGRSVARRPVAPPAACKYCGEALAAVDLAGEPAYYCGRCNLYLFWHRNDGKR